MITRSAQTTGFTLQGGQGDWLVTAALSSTEDDSDFIAGVNSGRGDELHTFYLGLNWYLCDHNLKLMGGIEYADLTTPVGGVDALTYTMAVRMKF